LVGTGFVWLLDLGDRRSSVPRPAVTHRPGSIDSAADLGTLLIITKLTCWDDYAEATNTERHATISRRERSRVAAGVVTLIVHLPNRGMKFLTKRHTGIIMGWVRASLIPGDVDWFGV